MGRVAHSAELTEHSETEGVVASDEFRGGGRRPAGRRFLSEGRPERDEHRADDDGGNQTFPGHGRKSRG